MSALLLGTVIGALVTCAALRIPARPPRAWAPPSLAGSHGRMLAVAALLGVTLVLPPVGALLAVGGWTYRHRRAHHAQQADARRVREVLPDLVDLLALASSAGLSLPVAHPLVAAHTGTPVGEALRAADEAATLGRPRADALLEALSPLGERARALAHVLSDHLRYGVPLLPALERTGLELRLDRRRRAELEARRVPVRLLGPLVSCVLPAFALLTVVPLLAASLDALPT